MLRKICLVFLVAGCAAAAVSDDDKRAIEHIHNSLRAYVQPEASDMQYMKWHDDAANLAQNWADACVRLTHNQPVDQVYGSCGQNIFISTARTSWEDVVKDWHSEVRDFTYGGDNDFQDTGHYTQVVWSTSHKVGCGVAKCRDSQGHFYNYICNYCPAGNYQNRLNRPYKKGTRCATCPDSCYYGLCY